MVRAFQASANGGKAVLLFAGDGPLARACKGLAGGDPRIHFLGQISNVQDYLQVADVFVSAALSEGLPNTVLEAMASGLPTVLSDIPAHREILDFALIPGTNRLTYQN